jgi:hypothetical protein
VRLAAGKAPVAPKGLDTPGCLGYAILVPMPLPSGLSTGESPRPTISSAPFTKPGLITVVVSPSAGVVELGGVTTLRTPEGIGLGMSAKQVYTTYRNVAFPSRLPTTMLTGVPGNDAASYVFDVDSSGLVRSMWLRASGDLHCG